MQYKSPQQISEIKSTSAYQAIISQNLRLLHVAEKEKRAKRADELLRLAQGIEGGKFSCFLRENGRYSPLPQDHCLRSQITAFLDNRAVPFCKVERRLNLQASGQLSRGDVFLDAWGNMHTLGGMSRERIRKYDQLLAGLNSDNFIDVPIEVELEWERDIWLAVNSEGEPIRVPDDAGEEDAGAEEGKTTDGIMQQRRNFLIALADAFGIPEIVENETKGRIRSLCVEHLNGDPFRFTDKTFNRTWENIRERMRCKNPANAGD